MPVLAVARLKHISGLVEDDAVNNFAIATADGIVTVAQAAAIGALVADWYVTPWIGGTTASGGYISGQISRVAGACTVSVYDLAGHLDGSDHGSPIAMVSFTMPGVLDAVDLPNEVAACLTLEAEGRTTAGVESGITRPKQRHTGRIYFGPLCRAAQETAASARGIRPRIGMLEGLRKKTLDLDTALEAVPGNASNVAVWSRADVALRRIEAVSTDDAYDTQRRRGNAPLARIRELVPA